MKQIRNRTIYRARFQTLKLKAFGIDQTLPWVVDIDIYQARVSPELWRARPQMERVGHKWEAASAEALQRLIAGDFEECVKPWYQWTPPAIRPALSSPTSRGEHRRSGAA